MNPLINLLGEITMKIFEACPGCGAENKRGFFNVYTNVHYCDDCNIYLDDRSISQQHAVVTLKSGKVWIKDLKSKNKTLINRKEVKEEIELEPGSKIRFGGLRAKLISKK